MKLTNIVREKFLDDVMKGIPRKTKKFDLNDAVEEIQKVIESSAPLDVIEFSKKYPSLVERTKLIYLKPFTEIKNYKSSGRTRSYSRTPSIYTYNLPNIGDIDLTHWLNQKELSDKEDAERNAIRLRLSGIAYSCTTFSQLKEALPELVSYIPEPPQKTKNLPVLAGNIVTDLLQFGLKVPKEAVA